MDENRDQRPLSSEELLKQARDGLGDSPYSSEQDTPVEEAHPSMTPQPEPSSAVDVEMEPMYEEEVAPSDYEPHLPPDEPAYWPPPAPEPEESNDWTSATGSPAPAPVPPRESALKKIWRARGIVIILIIAGIALFSFLDKTKNVDDIAVGDCFNWPEDDVFFEIDPISCDATHDIEVYANIDLAGVDPSYSTTAIYPGDQTVYQAALSACLDQFEPYVGMSYDASALYIDAFTPTEEGWNEADDRVVNCVLFQVSADASDILPSSQSMRNAQR